MTCDHAQHTKHKVHRRHSKLHSLTDDISHARRLLGGGDAGLVEVRLGNHA
jgi:hypothetical protein